MLHGVRPAGSGVKHIGVLLNHIVINVSQSVFALQIWLWFKCRPYRMWHHKVWTTNED